jgi:hypothetical protein
LNHLTPTCHSILCAFRNFIFNGLLVSYGQYFFESPAQAEAGIARHY